MKYWGLYDYCMAILGIFALAVLLLCVGGLATALADSYIDYRTFDKQAACRVKRMEPARRFLSDSVICLPAIQRQDTTTVMVR